MLLVNERADLLLLFANKKILTDIERETLAGSWQK
jgi:hypothetical protein